MEFVTGDLKNSETIVSMYPINIELIGYSLSAESTDIKVGETTKLTLSNAGTAVTEGITWASSMKQSQQLQMVLSLVLKKVK